MAFDLSSLLQPFLGGANTTLDRAGDDFDQVVGTAPRAQVAEGMRAALRSDQTPPFPQMVSQMFGQSDPNQRAGMLNALIAGLGPALLSSIAGGALGNLSGDRDQAQPHISPEQATQLTPEQVQEIAATAENDNPGIVDRMGDFYADNPALVKAIGGAALAIVLGQLAQGMRR